MAFAPLNTCIAITINTNRLRDVKPNQVLTVCDLRKPKVGGLEYVAEINRYQLLILLTFPAIGFLSANSTHNTKLIILC